MNIALLTSRGQWLENYIEQFSKKLDGASIYYSHKDIEDKYDVLFLLGYNQLVDKDLLNNNKHNIHLKLLASPYCSETFSLNMLTSNCQTYIISHQHLILAHLKSFVYIHSYRHRA